MLQLPPPHTCLEKLEKAGVNQNDISLKVGIHQSSISRIQNQLFKRTSWQTVERIQSLYQHVCINNEPLNDFVNYEDFIRLEDAEHA